MAGLSISLLGPVQVLVDGTRSAAFSYNKARALLAYLAIESGHTHQRDTLVGLLWPDLPNDAARANLRQALADLRQAIGDAAATPPFLHITRETVQFNANSVYALDVAAFRELLAACEAHSHRHIDRCRLCAARLEQAAALYRGDFLAELSLTHSAPFEAWVVMQRERLHQSALDALGHLATFYERSGALEQARRTVARQLELDPWCEEAHRTLMRLHTLSGRRSAALHQYEICRRILAHEFDAQPDATTIALYRLIHSGGMPSAAGTGPLASQLASLPLPPTPLVGREEELAQLGEMLANRAYRLITIHGPGGIGKTQLALAAALHHAEAFEHGMAFVPLEAVPSAEFLAPAILAALDIPVKGQRPSPEQLVAFLHDRELLLVLDSFEHLAMGAGLLAELLQRVPRLTLLVTSQVRLALQAEWLFDLHGLSYPPAGAVVDLAKFGAPRLLLQCIQQVQPVSTLSPEDARAAATICRLVAGLPLAIELAAAATHGRSLQEVATALEDNPQILETQWQDAPRRHTSIQAVLDHAWHLLSPAESRVFRCLAVFRGGFPASAAFEVAGATIPVLRALIDKSLLQRDTTGRYSMHELVRPYAVEKLCAAGEAEETARRHLEYCVALAETAEPCLRSVAQDIWLDKLELEHGNIRAALNWALAQGDLLAAARMSSALRRFWHRRGHGVEGRAWLSAALDQREVLPVRMQAKVLYSLGVLVWHQDLFAAAQAYLVESVALWRAANDTSGLAYALSMLGVVVDQQAGYAEAVPLLEESLALFHHTGDRWGLGLALFRLGLVRTTAGEQDAQAQLAESLGFFQATGDRWGTGLALFGLGFWAYTQEEFALARDRLEQALAEQRATGDQWLTALTLNCLGDVSLCRKAYEEAERAYQESLELFRLLDSPGRVVKTLANLGLIAWARGDIQAAQALIRQGLDLSCEVGHPGGMPQCLQGLAGVLGAQGQLVPAVRLLAAATTLHSAANAISAPTDRLAHEAILASLAAQLDAPAFALAWAEGQQMTLEQAVAGALDRGF